MKPCPGATWRRQPFSCLCTSTRPARSARPLPNLPAYHWRARYNRESPSLPPTSLGFVYPTFPFECLSVRTVSGIFCEIIHLTTHRFTPLDALVLSQAAMYSITKTHVPSLTVLVFSLLSLAEADSATCESGWEWVESSGTFLSIHTHRLVFPRLVVQLKRARPMCYCRIAASELHGVR